MKKLKQTKNSAPPAEFLTNQDELEKYASIGKVAHELFHDLLNPITGFILYVNLNNKIKLKRDDTQKQIKQISKFIYKIKNFIHLVQESLINQNQKELLDFNKEIQNIMSLLYYKAKRFNVSIIFITKQKIQIMIEKIRIYQIIINLLSNAIDSYENKNLCKTRYKKQIVIKTWKKLDKIFMIIKDNGCGIKTSNLSKIFQQNYTNKKDGFGLGLFAVKRIIEQELNGQISVKSINNFGTEFTIQIPIKIESKTKSLKIANDLQINTAKISV